MEDTQKFSNTRNKKNSKKSATPNSPDSKKRSTGKARSSSKSRSNRDEPPVPPSEISLERLASAVATPKRVIGKKRKATKSPSPEQPAIPQPAFSPASANADLDDVDSSYEPDADLVNDEPPAASVITELQGTICDQFGVEPEFFVMVNQEGSEIVCRNVSKMCKIMVRQAGQIDDLRQPEVIWNTGLPSPDSPPPSEPSSPEESPRQTVAVNVSHVERLDIGYTPKQLENFINYLHECSANNIKDKRVELISESVRETFTDMFTIRYKLCEGRPNTWLKRWSALELARNLTECFATKDTAYNKMCSWLVVLEETISHVEINVRDQNTFRELVDKIYHVMKTAKMRNTPDEAAIDTLLNIIRKGRSKANATLHSRLKARKKDFHDLPQFCRALLKECMDAKKALDEADQWEHRVSSHNGNGNRFSKDHSKNGGSRPAGGSNSHTGNGPAKIPRFTCDGCGFMDARAPGNICHNCAGHPDRNVSGPWKDCAARRSILALKPNLTNPRLIPSKRANGESVTDAQRDIMDKERAKFRQGPPTGSAPAGKGKSGQFGQSPKGKAFDSLVSMNTNTDLVPFTITANNGTSLSVQGLVDTGALDANYVSFEIGEWVRQNQSEEGSPCAVPAELAIRKDSIVLAGTNKIELTKGAIAFDLSFLNETSHQQETIRCLHAKIINSKFDIIIGLPSIRENNLLSKLTHHFSSRIHAATSACGGEISRQVAHCPTCNGPSSDRRKRQNEQNSEHGNGNSTYLCLSTYEREQRANSDAQIRSASERLRLDDPSSFLLGKTDNQLGYPKSTNARNKLTRPEVGTLSSSAPHGCISRSTSPVALEQPCASYLPHEDKANRIEHNSMHVNDHNSYLDGHGTHSCSPNHPCPDLVGLLANKKSYAAPVPSGSKRKRQESIDLDQSNQGSYSYLHPSQYSTDLALSDSLDTNVQAQTQLGQEGAPTQKVRKLKKSETSNFDVTGAPAPVSAIKMDNSCSGRSPATFCRLLEVDSCYPREVAGMEQLNSWQYAGLKPQHLANHQLCSITERLETHSDVFDNAYPDNDEVIWKEDPFDKEESEPAHVLVGKINIFGSTKLQASIKALCFEYHEIFSEVIKAEPARIEPMEIAVDHNKWYCSKNRGPPRPQSAARQAAIKKQVDKYLRLGVIQPSKASEYSQVHLVPKSEPNEWRFCLDYVRLNEATIGVESWPIPNIPQMIQRIGSKRPKVFGVMDMTSGYHQAPLAVSARLLTAFICFMGVFEWLRVPMGARNAGSYFQKSMAKVLVGLLYIVCELYIDDIIVFGDSEEDFVHNLRKVFQRFKDHNITLNPSKCRLGLDKIEFVGHVITPEGITFSDEKKLKVLNFPLPEKGKQLLGFLGLVNYFRDHLPDMTGKLKGLRSLVTNLKAPIKWTPEFEAQFIAVKDAVANCPALFFITADGEVFVMTDASDFGIGAYIYQIVNGKERPILFVSKALHGAQLNWSTIEKEAYAIFYTLKTHEHLLRDIKFTLKTDHKNLTYINLESSQKVRRWKLFLQDFNFHLEHVAGIDNAVADAFSRLCSISATEVDEPANSSLFAIESSENLRIPPEEFRKISSVHNSKAGHFGVEKTLDALRASNHTWKRMRRHVTQFIQKCPVCQLSSDRKVAINVAPFTRASYHPMEVLNIDAIGPLPEDENKNKYILVIIDCFSRWVELFGIPDTSALSAAKALLEHCGRFGVPALIRSDRGPQFANELIEKLVDLLGTEHELTTAYSKEENAIVERANKEVMRHLRAIVYDDRIYNKWSTDQLPLVMRILNSEQKLRTGVSPAEILFGNAVDLGRYVLHRPTSSPSPDRNLNDHVEQMLERQRAYIEVAQKTQRDYDTHHMSEFDPEFTDYPVNSYVLWSNPAGTRSKIHAKLQGPYQVIAVNHDIYKIQDLLNSKIYETHISNLRPFNHDPEHHDPVIVAQHNSQEFVIDEILGHQGDPKRRSTLQFMVRWKGFGPEHDTMEPYSYLRDTEKLHNYLKANNMKTLIPRKFKG
jgi:transposase InsO family protein